MPPSKKQIAEKSSFADLHFPRGGMDVSSAFDRQPVRQLADGSFAGTTPNGINVRAFEPGTGRGRGGQRPGLLKYVAGRVNGSASIQEIVAAVRTDLSIGGGGHDGGMGINPMTFFRETSLIAVAGGNVAKADISTYLTWTTVTSGTAALDGTVAFIHSAVINGLIYFCDGNNWKYYNPSDNTVHAWVATSGTLPVDSAGRLPRLICNWRNRCVLAGLPYSPQNYFMSAVGDPANWDYSPTSQTPTQAIAGNLAPQGQSPDLITGLAPMTDDVLVIGCDHSLWRFNGDPAAGGQIDMVSDTIGMAWGRAWCRDPQGNLYFYTGRSGIYRMEPGGKPVRMSQAIEREQEFTSTDLVVIRLIWDDRFQGIHVFITVWAGAATSIHFFWEYRTGAWWKDHFANNNHNPKCCYNFFGPTAADRDVLIGSWDGYVRAIDYFATDDDGTAIASLVQLGPLITPDFDEVMFKDMQALMGQGLQGSVTFSVLGGATPERASTATALVTGTWAADRNLTNYVRRAAHAFYVQIDAVTFWSMEAIRCRIAGSGKVRRRGY